MVDPDGKPVVGARCYGLSSTWGADQDARRRDFRGPWAWSPDHPRQLIFAHKGRRLVGSVIIKDEDTQGDAPLVVRLERAGSIKGRLVDEDGLPLAGACSRSLTFDLDGTTTCRRPGATAAPLARQRDLHQPTPTAGSRSTDSNRASSLHRRPSQGPTRIPAGYRRRSSATSCSERLGEVRDLGDVKVKAEPRMIGPGRRRPMRSDPRAAKLGRPLGALCPRRADALGPPPGRPSAPPGRLRRHLGRTPARPEGRPRSRRSTGCWRARPGPAAFPTDFAAFADRLADLALAAPEPNRLKGWWVYRMLFGPDPLTERLTLMWHDHFATSNLKVNDLSLMRRQNETLRSLGRGPVRPAVARDAPRPGAAGLARRPGEYQGPPQREPRPRADGAVHARHRPLFRGRRQAGRPRPDGLEARGRRSPVRPGPARRGDQDDPRPHRRVRR